MFDRFLASSRGGYMLKVRMGLMTSAQRFVELMKVYLALSGSDLKALGALSLRMVGCIQTIHERLVKLATMLLDGEPLTTPESIIESTTRKHLTDSDAVIDEVSLELLNIMISSTRTFLSDIEGSDQIISMVDNLRDHTVNGQIKALIRCLSGIDKLRGKDHYSTCRRILMSITNEQTNKATTN